MADYFIISPSYTVQQIPQAVPLVSRILSCLTLKVIKILRLRHFRHVIANCIEITTKNSIDKYSEGRLLTTRVSGLQDAKPLIRLGPLRGLEGMLQRLEAVKSTELQALYYCWANIDLTRLRTHRPLTPRPPCVQTLIVQAPQGQLMHAKPGGSSRKPKGVFQDKALDLHTSL
jgi:hypothetical protein